VLTVLGKEFRDEVEASYDVLTGAVERARLVTRSRREVLRLGLFSDSGASQIPRIVKAFERINPDCIVEATGSQSTTSSNPSTGVKRTS
jgi:DNA-binding transcriptional LysR family regulator